MKKFIITSVFLIMAGGAFWSERRQLARTVEERERARVELEQLARRATEIDGEAARLESDLAAREKTLQHRRDQAAAETEAMRRAAATNAFGPPGGVPTWSEKEAFVWMEKRRFPSLNVAAFRATDSQQTELTPNTAHLLDHLGRQFLEAHPEFAHPSSLTPEKAAEAMAEYAKLLTEAAAGVDGKQRQALEAALQRAEITPRPGAMTQPPAEYRLNEDAATLLGMTDVERGAVGQATRTMMEAYHELERRHVAVSDEDAAEESSGFQRSLASFKVAAFPGEGGAVKTEWMAQLNAVLGADRAEYLLQMSSGWIRSDLGDFGEAERTITIRESTGSGGFTDKSTKGHYASQGTSGPASIPPGWRHLIARPAEGGLPRVRMAE